MIHCCPVCNRDLSTDSRECWHRIPNSPYRVIYDYTENAEPPMMTFVQENLGGDTVLEFEGHVILDKERIEKLLLLK